MHTRFISAMTWCWLNSVQIPISSFGRAPKCPHSLWWRWERWVEHTYRDKLSLPKHKQLAIQLMLLLLRPSSVFSFSTYISFVQITSNAHYLLVWRVSLLSCTLTCFKQLMQHEICHLLNSTMKTSNYINSENCLNFIEFALLINSVHQIFIELTH